MTSPTDRTYPPHEVSLDRDRDYERRNDPQEPHTTSDARDPLPDETPAAAEQRAEATGRHITVDLCGQDVRVVPAGAWRASTNRKIRIGDVDGFMEDILHPDDYDLYIELDPTSDDFTDFVAAAQKASGGPGKSHGPRSSSRPTPRR